MYKRFQGCFLSNSLLTGAISNGKTRTGIYAEQCQAAYKGEGFKIYGKPSKFDVIFIFAPFNRIREQTNLQNLHKQDPVKSQYILN